MEVIKLYDLSVLTNSNILKVKKEQFKNQSTYYCTHMKVVNFYDLKNGDFFNYVCNASVLNSSGI